MPTKTPIKVKVRVKKFSPFKFALHEILRPHQSPPITSLIIWCMIGCKVNRSTAETAVYNALEYIDVEDLGWVDRDKLHLPNISNRYPRHPEYRKYWKSSILEPSD